MCRPCAAWRGRWGRRASSAKVSGLPASHSMNAEKPDLRFSRLCLIQCEGMPSHWMRHCRHPFITAQKRVPLEAVPARETLSRLMQLPDIRALCHGSSVTKTSQVVWGEVRDALPAFQFPSWYNRLLLHRAQPQVLPAFQFPSWYNSLRFLRYLTVSLAGLPIPQLVQFSARHGRTTPCLAGLPIPQLVQFHNELSLNTGGSCRPSNSPVGTIHP